MRFDDLPPSPQTLWFYSRLPAHQRKFVDELIVSQNPQQSATRSGFSNFEIAMKEISVRCAIRERLETITEMASVTAADVRRELKHIYEGDPTEITGVWRVPCRHCWGEGNRFQYTDPELYYVEQAQSYGENNWPSSCITNEFGPLIFKHATAAWVAGKNRKEVDIKGGSGYSRNREINSDCPQCHGIGEPMMYVCDTRYLSESAKKIFKGVRVGDNKIEVMTIDKTHALTLLARDTQVGIERREITINLPRTKEEFEETVRKMSVDELEMFIANMITLGEEEYEIQGAGAQRRLPKFSRGN
jgi:hypothetical protein